MAVKGLTFKVDTKALQKQLQQMSVDASLEFKMLVATTASNIHNDAKREAPSGVSGLLRGTLYMKPEDQGMAAWVVSPLAYAPHVERGRKPGTMPPVEPLERWGHVVLGKDGLGWALAITIKKKGTKAQPFLKPAVEQHREEFLNDAAALLHKVVNP